MTTPLDDQALDDLVTRVQQDQTIAKEQLGALVDELRAHRIQTSAEARLRSNHTALMGLVRSDALARGDLEQALREITQTAVKILRVGRAGVWRLDEEHGRLVCADLYRARDDTHEAGRELARTELPAHFEALLGGDGVVAHDARADPRTAELVDSYLDPLGIGAVLDVAVQVDARTIGRVRAEHLGAARNWSTLDVQFAEALADFTALAIESHRRRQTEEQLRDTVAVAEERLRTIERQRMAIADLSAPIIDVWDGILVVPLVGLVDTQRSIDLTERLLERISSSGARSVILDLTGIDVIDTMTASHLLQMLRSARLLGAYCVLGGISPQIAQTLVQLEIDLSELRMVRNLEQALAVCLRRHEDAGRTG